MKLLIASVILWMAWASVADALTKYRPPHYKQWLCIYSHENAGYGWKANTGNGYYGGLQMDWSFMRTYGSEFMRRYGTADRWPSLVQMLVAERAYSGYHGERARGFTPWPNTARMCGLL